MRSVHLYSSIFAASLFIRLAVLLATNAPDRALSSAYEHADIARALVSGHGFSFHFFTPPGEWALTSQQAPLVAYVLAAAYLVFGPESSAALGSVLFLQAVVASLGIVALAWSVELTTRARVFAIATGSLGALYPPIVIASGHIQAVTWNMSALAGMICAAILFSRGRYRMGAALSVISGIIAWHADPIVGGVTMMILHFAWIHAKQARRWVLASVGLIVLGMVPWGVRNYVVHGQWIAVKDSFWYVFWQGNNQFSHGTDKLRIEQELFHEWSPTASVQVADRVRQGAVSVDSKLSESFRLRLASMPNEIDRMDAFKDLILAELTARPTQYLLHCAHRLKLWLWFDDTNPRSFVLAYRLNYIALVFLAAAGVWQERSCWRKWWPFLVAALSLTVVHVLIITSARFRLPLEMLLIPWAAVAVLHGVRSVAKYLQSLAASLAGVRLARPTSY